MGTASVETRNTRNKFYSLLASLMTNRCLGIVKSTASGNSFKALRQLIFQRRKKLYKVNPTRSAARVLSQVTFAPFTTSLSPRRGSLEICSWISTPFAACCASPPSMSAAWTSMSSGAKHDFESGVVTPKQTKFPHMRGKRSKNNMSWRPSQHLQIKLNEKMYMNLRQRNWQYAPWKEQQQHASTHLRFADWCARCVCHRSRQDRHMADGTSRRSGVPTISFVFCHPRAVPGGVDLARAGFLYIVLVMVCSQTGYVDCICTNVWMKRSKLNGVWNSHAYVETTTLACSPMWMTFSTAALGSFGMMFSFLRFKSPSQWAIGYRMLEGVGSEISFLKRKI